METTRHYTATVYIVNDGATALHDHKRLDMWLPPGGHIDRDELPHEAAIREVSEETGLDVTLLAARTGASSATVEPLPEPAHLQLADVNVCDGHVGHQHIDFVYFGSVEHRDIQPEDGEIETWHWFTAAELREDGDHLDSDVIAHGIEAIKAVENDR
ncbi:MULTISPECIES: NUDIX hydrolase [unclassified Haladaptatus]|uniref:NUDIX hydrolase n=1 Tax=unclassified Haladaptatus TaxID=2622732 RepID=UPI0023E7E93F|nr:MULTISPECIES: NUDIX domain-containing protein [unclassified Haladaptatus]